MALTCNMVFYSWSNFEQFKSFRSSTNIMKNSNIQYLRGSLRGFWDLRFWHERVAFQRSAFGRSTAGSDVVATIIISLLARACGVPAVGVRAVDCWQWRSGHYFHQSFLFFPPRFFSRFSPSRPFLQERLLASKNLFSESCLECPKT